MMSSCAPSAADCFAPMGERLCLQLGAQGLGKIGAGDGGFDGLNQPAHRRGIAAAGRSAALRSIGASRSSA